MLRGSRVEGSGLPTSQTPAPWKIALAALGKCTLALAVFSIIFGGWIFAKAREPLPGASDREGACVLWFVGSSSMSRWNTLQQDLQPWIAQNRGIGGATMSEINLHFEHDQAKHRPQAIIYYAGDNDLAFGRTVDETIADLREFLAIKSRLFGQTPVFIISLKPSPTRWDRRAQQGEFNAAARAMADKQADVAYVDTVPLLLEQGRPGPFFNEDGLHLNDEGYRRWKVALRHSMSEAMPIDVLKKCDPQLLQPTA
jgi:lysophospholipase L1-like esterase